MGVAISLKNYLTSHDIDYSEYTHEHTATALETATVSHVPGALMVKAVLLSDGTEYLLAALPADRRLEINRLCDFMEQDYELATEDEIAEVFSDCEVGAIPATGQAYGLKMIWDDSLVKPDSVYLEAGDHETLIHVDKDNFLRLMGEASHTTISQPMAVF